MGQERDERYPSRPTTKGISVPIIASPSHDATGLYRVIYIYRNKFVSQIDSPLQMFRLPRCYV